MSGYTIDEARRIAINCASSYKSSLEDKQFIIIYRDKDTNMINLSLGQSGKHNNKMSVDCIVDRHFLLTTRIAYAHTDNTQ